jgi:hypothetical protein
MTAPISTDKVLQQIALLQQALGAPWHNRRITDIDLRNAWRTNQTAIHSLRGMLEQWHPADEALQKLKVAWLQCYAATEKIIVEAHPRDNDVDSWAESLRALSQCYADSGKN